MSSDVLICRSDILRTSSMSEDETKLFCSHMPFVFVLFFVLEYDMTAGLD